MGFDKKTIMPAFAQPHKKKTGEFKIEEFEAFKSRELFKDELLKAEASEAFDGGRIIEEVSAFKDALEQEKKPENKTENQPKSKTEIVEEGKALIQGVGEVKGVAEQEKKKTELFLKENALLEERALKEYEKSVAEEKKRLAKPASQPARIVRARDLKTKKHAEGPDSQDDDDGEKEKDENNEGF